MENKKFITYNAELVVVIPDESDKFFGKYEIYLYDIESGSVLAAIFKDDGGKITIKTIY